MLNDDPSIYLRLQDFHTKFLKIPMSHNFVFDFQNAGVLISPFYRIGSLRFKNGFLSKSYPALDLSCPRQEA